MTKKIIFEQTYSEESIIDIGEDVWWAIGDSLSLEENKNAKIRVIIEWINDVESKTED